MKKKTAKALVLLLCLTAVLLSLTACGGGVEEKLVGEWYEEGSRNAAFTLYSDGEAEIRVNGWDHPGSWSVVNKDILKLSPLLDDIITCEIQSVKDGCLTVLNDDGDTVVFYNSQEEALANG